MALIYADRVRESSTTTGTGTLTLAGAVAGFQAFTTAFATGAAVTFCTENGTDWEVAEGVFTTSGTTLSRVRIIASSNAGAAVSWGAGSKNVFAVLSARDVNPPQGVRDGADGTSGCLAATFSRLFPNNVTAAPTTAILRLVRIYLPQGLPVTNIMFVSGTTAGVTLLNQWFGLFDSARVVLAKTADDTSTAWPASTAKTLAVASGPFITTYAGLHYVGILVKATTVPTLVTFSGGVNNSPLTLAPIPCGDSTTGLTNPASCTGTQTAITAKFAFPYAELS